MHDPGEHYGLDVLTCQVALKDCSPNDDILAFAVKDWLIPLTGSPKLAIALTLSCTEVSTSAANPSIHIGFSTRA